MFVDDQGLYSLPIMQCSSLTSIPKSFCCPVKIIFSGNDFKTRSLIPVCLAIQ